MKKNICLLCKSLSITKIFESYNKHGRHIIDSKDKFEIYKCRNCELVFIQGIELNSSYYSKYYSADYYESSIKNNILPYLYSLLSSYSLQKKENLLLKFLPKFQKKYKILDVGCGNGDFLEHLNQRFDKTGLEINKDGIEICRKKNIKVINSDISKFKGENRRFDVITLWQVLEHLNNPVPVMKKINNMLTKNGILVLSTPNTDSLGFYLSKIEWFHLDSPRHLLLFNNKSIKILVSNAGFNIITSKYEFYDYPLDLFWSLINSTWKYLIYPFYPLFKIIDKETLTIICKKKRDLAI